MIKVLIVDDSLTTREYLKHIIDSNPRLQIAGEAKDGEEALKKAETAKPNVIIMDIQMPGMNGYEATRAIMEKCPVPIIIHSALVAPEQTENIFKSMKVGAVAVSQKPPGLGHPESKQLVEKLLRTVKLMSEVKVVRLLKQKEKIPQTKPDHKKKLLNDAAKPSTGIIAIGASTGGPPVLQTILSNLNNDFTIPIVIVQHIANGFLEGMLDWLSKTTHLTLKIPKTGEPVKNGHVYFAPEDHHIDITPSRVFRIYKIDAHENFKRPISHLFSSVAKICKENATGVLLTGMGNDGAIGLKEMKAHGAITLAQDKESSVVFGMPGEAIKINAATYVLNPTDITSFINKVSREMAS
ncbi:MAG: chemotaxis-specific protein-glutamate methyltransferase CheB [Desulfobacteraceae bacterium]|nr:chemotaxis-specific protein-glutamate methyltransferase CheB [Desulfobacteraceae bacterium]MBC2754124.1 chemotaxis-specific protein-glutamate methyltransferase CheB [Desulfobacteraceae bacterium]